MIRYPLINSVTDVELEPEKLESLLWQSLGEKICRLILTRDDTNPQSVCGNLFTYKMKINFYVFHLSMKHGISG